MKTSKETNTTILTKSKKQFDFSALSVGFIGSKKAQQIEVITVDGRTVYRTVFDADNISKITLKKDGHISQWSNNKWSYEEVQTK